MNLRVSPTSADNATLSSYARTIGERNDDWLKLSLRADAPRSMFGRILGMARGERIRRIRDGQFIEIHYTVEDRKALNRLLRDVKDCGVARAEPRPRGAFHEPDDDPHGSRSST